MTLNLLEGNYEALELLDWSILTSHISSLAHFELTKENLIQPPRARGAHAIQTDLDLLESYLHSYDDYNIAFNVRIRSLPEDKKFFQLIQDNGKGKFFEAQELHFFALLAECAQHSLSLFKDLVFPNDSLIDAKVLGEIKRKIVLPLRDFVDPSGNISYERHPVLKKLYAEVLALESDLRQSIQKISKTEPYSSRLQLDSYDIINDRYVLALRSDSYQAELGPIVARSQSGMTLFVEPYEMRDKGNKRVHLLAEIEATLLKLTIDLSKALHHYAREFHDLSNWCLAMDWLNTKATYTQKMGLSKPTLNSKFSFEINGLFHPLLPSPVKNNVVLDSHHKGLIISGPNTGGKTVALKSLTLSLLLLHLGLYLPATHASVYPVDHLFYFSHDHQNLAAGLSSFASEAKHYLELLTGLGPFNLILIDEIFNSTSSEEASALAISFLDEVHSASESKIVLSTHHQVLKTFMHAREDYVSAHVGYDFDLNRPTYKLILGEPGSSLAFKIFENLSERFGIQTNIGEKAKTLLDAKQVTYEALLQELSQKKIDLDKLLTKNRSLNIELSNQKASMEGTLFLERERLLGEYTKKIRTLFDRAENLLSEVKNEKVVSRKKLNDEIVDIQAALNKETPQKPKQQDPENVYGHLRPISFEELQTGDTVFSLTVKKNVKVQNLNPRKKEVQIKHGTLSLWVNTISLRRPSGAKIPPPKVNINIQKSVRGDIEVDCRGMRLEEFQKVCGQSIEEVVTGEIPFVTIIHGHGDGVLKSWLRTHLKKEHPDLRWENIEGNDGCTKIYEMASSE